jgi:hypothetical protein
VAVDSPGVAVAGLGEVVAAGLQGEVFAGFEVVVAG